MEVGLGASYSPWGAGTSGPGPHTVDSKKLEPGCRKIYATFASIIWLGVGGQSCSNFVEPTVRRARAEMPCWHL